VEGIRPLHFNYNGEYIMSISKDDLVKRKEQIKKDFDALVEQIKEQEEKVKSMKNNLNALAGASQQCDLFIKQIEDKGEPMPPEKAQALEIATS
jgi:DnaJ-domain-containing protein 1